MPPAEWAPPSALFLLAFVGSLAIAAALSAFQTFITTHPAEASRPDAAFASFSFFRKPERLLLAGAFLTTTLHLLLGILGYVLMTRFFTFARIDKWFAYAGTTVVMTVLLLAGRLYFSDWGKRRQQASATPVLLSLLSGIYAVGSPFVWLILPLQKMAWRTRAAFGAPSPTEELSLSLEQTPTEPASPQEKGLLKAIVNFSSITVRQIMRARADMIAFQRRMPFPALLKQIQQWGYSRVPVYSEGLDKIDGILYVKDILPYLNAPADFVWQNLIRTPYFVPETKKIDELLREFQERRVHMAIVVNEYGDTTGLLTLEDVIEEIVGEIHDELDEEEDRYYTQLDEHTFLFEGRTSLHDFSKIVDPPTDLMKDVKNEVESVAGLMLRLFSRIPHTGEEIQFGPYLFHIESADSKKIKKIRVHEIVTHPQNEKE
ncbi:transporter associated domain-containing protein [Rufibacter radiotolerans]|uniref:transporter associated domain-containing protein n=1 Tax=Rufibacter radiotolerans TaxID=1379910 RepID=UPI00097154F4|nr:transporter associated domain-containing protein [Rufibacter radiotolerans]